jgi:VanZ family protein
VLYAALIFYFSSESNPLPMLTENVWDKLLHAVEYGGLAVLLSVAWRGEGVGRGSAMAIAVALTTLYAATDEWHQHMVPGRDASVWDWAADAVGAFLGAGGGILLTSAVAAAHWERERTTPS